MTPLDSQPASRPAEDHVAAAMLAAIVESSEDAILSKNLQGIIQTWNKGAERLFGYTASEAVGKPVTILIPEDRLDEEPTILARIQAGERVDHFETVRRRKDGTLLDISLTISPILNSRGEIIGASKIARDISERKRLAEGQALLLREMHHRVKNLFALTGGLVLLAARTAETPAALAASIRERLAALSQAHEMTLPNLEAGDTVRPSTSLFTLIGGLVAPYQDADNSRLDFKGRDFEVGGRNITNLALLLHEFTTNSAKYGALSRPDGRIEISAEEIGDEVHVSWLERNGPPVAPQAGPAGFGTRLEQTVTASLEATITKEWHKTGLVIRLAFPIAMLAE